MKDRLLIVDDDEAFCGFLTDVLKEEYAVASFTDPIEAIRYLRENGADMVLTDLVMPNIDGMKLLQIIKAESFETDVVMMTAFANVENAVDAMKKGAYDYIVKPFKIDELSIRLRNVSEKRRILQDNIVLQKYIDDEHRPDNMIGESTKMKEVFHLIEVFSQTEATVLITGESGTGKELVARALHSLSKSKKHRFVAINCSTIPENLLESELFGVMRGAFSGASVNKPGLFEFAQGGTVFLDEIGEMPLSLQPKLLRVLEEKRLRRLGGTSDIDINARVICATNRDLNKLIEENKFRRDLFYRINNLSISLPALRERKDDIPLYVVHFLAARKKIHPMALGLLTQYSWPGNVRELKSVIEQLVILTDMEVITPSALPPFITRFSGIFDDSGQSYTDEKKKLLDNFNREIITRALLKNYGNVTNAAKELSLDRGNFQKLMRKYQIISKDFKNRD